MKTNMKESSILQLFNLYSYFDKMKDEVRVEKTKEILVKVKEEEFSIAFCGHFSAGKSSIINYILGQQVLPSSPIPTSANIVKIKKGDGHTKVTLNNGKRISFPPPVDISKIKQLSKNGEDIKKIDLSLSSMPYSDHLALLDTPGIDSNDDAHKLATASSFHLAESIFYVTDYNHIQSEVNFQFTRELAQMEKKLYVIVNQIDKHQESELSFTDFKNNVKRSFREWDVPVEAYYFTSMRDLENPHNDIEKVIAKVKDLSDEPSESDILSLTKQLIKEHIKWKSKESEDSRHLMESIANTYDDHEKILDFIYRTERKSSLIRNYRHRIDKEFQDEMNRILENANLMPFETREKTRLYLESNLTSFKVGKLFGKSKTIQEKERRRQELLKDLEKQTETTLLWHLRDALNRIIHQYPGEKEQGQALIHAHIYKIPFDHIIEIAPLTSVNGELVLNFSKSVADSIRKEARKSVKVVIEQLMNAWEIEEGQILQAIQEDNKIAKDLLTAWNSWQQALAEERKFEENIESNLKNQSSHSYSEVIYIIEEWESIDEEVEELADKNEDQSMDLHPSAHKATADKIKKYAGINLDQLSIQLSKASDILVELPGLKKISTDLEEQAKKIQKRTFTIALFGAFSAGKSSFANTLLNAEVLPVSPNPTTAVINRILPPDDTYSHGEAVIHAKTEEMLLDDLNEIWKEEGIKSKDIGQAKKQARRVLEKNHLSIGLKSAFLEAFVKGVDYFMPKIGTDFQVGLEEFASFAADESKSCFIERIDLYYDCPLTREGIILVDTPGADSINARHTGTTFNYIKHSDAICFVTYYNHPFSRADRNFLDQLGRVKDSFSMDKMFFILNAADLAHNQEEKDAVVDYLQSELQTSGIAHPRIFPLSSRDALKVRLEGTQEKETQASAAMFEQFEKEFYNFIRYDLTEISISTSLSEFRQAQVFTKRLLELSNETEDKKQQRKIQLHKEWNEIKKTISQIDVQNEQVLLKQEMEELIYYCKQRIFLRFGDMFKESFSPSVIRDNRKTVEKALTLLLQQIKTELWNEMQATALRLEYKSINLMRDIYIKLTKTAKSINEDWAFREPELTIITEFECEQPLVHLSMDDFKKELKLFKNAQSFFEKNEKQLMQDTLSKKIDQYVGEFLQIQSDRLSQYLRDLMGILGKQLMEKLLAEGTDIYHGMEATMNAQSNPMIYHQAVDELEMIYHDIWKENERIEVHPKS